MADEQDRIEQIRSRRSREHIGGHQAQQPQVQNRHARQPIQARQISETQGQGGRVAGAGGASGPWLQDRVTLSLEAQIAMIEMRSMYKLSLADMNYHNKQKLISIRPGIFLKIEPTSCYKMVYHNRM
ncbi:MAG: hypothetical protein ACLFQV_02620 [Vulcanimicrobiota bacterium]